MTEKACHEDYCQRHIGMKAATSCSQCGAKICRECIQEFGYFCSPECLEESRANISDEDLARLEQDNLSLEEISRRTVYGLWISAAVILLLLSWWLWVSFVAAPGKPAWTWEPEEKVARMEILSVDGNYVNVLAGTTLYRVKAANGRLKQAIEMPGYSGGALIDVRTTPDKLFAVTSAEALAIDFKEGRALITRFRKACNGGTIAPDGSWVFVLHPQTFDYRTGTVEVPAGISCHALPGTGNPGWEKQAEEGYRYSKVVEADGYLVVLEETGSLYDAGATCRLGVLDSQTGKQAWRLTFDQGLVWGPEVKNGCIALQAGGTFVVIGLDGSQKWAAEVPRATWVSHVITDELAFLQQETGEDCRDLLTGRQIWRCGTIFNGQFLVEKDERLVASGFTSRVEAGASSLVPGGDGMDEILQDISSGSGGVLENLMSQPVLIAVDRKTGRRRWRRENVAGNFFGNGSRIVEILGVGSISMSQLFSGGGGRGTVIRQFSLRDGDTLYTRSLDYSVDAYAVVGDRLVGVAYGMPKRHDASLLMGLRLK